MNGRVYDPGLGRMLSPDPVTQAPENGQNYNRFTYAFNNPLKYTDPSGYVSDLNDWEQEAIILYRTQLHISPSSIWWTPVVGLEDEGVLSLRDLVDWWQASVASEEGDLSLGGEPAAQNPVVSADGRPLPEIFSNTAFVDTLLTGIANSDRQANEQRRRVGLVIRSDGKGGFNQGVRPNNLPSTLVVRGGQLGVDGLIREGLDPTGMAAVVMSLPRFGRRSAASTDSSFYFEYENVYDVPVVVSEIRRGGSRWIYMPGAEEAIEW